MIVEFDVLAFLVLVYRSFSAFSEWHYYSLSLLVIEYLYDLSSIQMIFISSNVILSYHNDFHLITSLINLITLYYHGVIMVSTPYYKLFTKCDYHVMM